MKVDGVRKPQRPGGRAYPFASFCASCLGGVLVLVAYLSLTRKLPPGLGEEAADQAGSDDLSRFFLFFVLGVAVTLIGVALAATHWGSRASKCSVLIASLIAGVILWLFAGTSATVLK